MKIIRSDNGLEFNLRDFYTKEGIIHQKTCVEIPQQNARAKRKHQHILNVARALRFQSGVPLKFWGHCIVHAVYLINMLPSKVINGKTLYEMLFQKIHEYNHLRVFGCLCFASTLKRARHKMDARGKKCIFIGYPANVKGYILYDLHSHSTFFFKGCSIL